MGCNRSYQILGSHGDLAGDTCPIVEYSDIAHLKLYCIVYIHLYGTSHGISQTVGS